MVQLERESGSCERQAPRRVEDRRTGLFVPSGVGVLPGGAVGVAVGVLVAGAAMLNAALVVVRPAAEATRV